MEERNNGLPELNKEIFICPHCKIKSRHKWKTEYSLKEQTINIMNNFLLEKRSELESGEVRCIKQFIDFIETKMPNHLLLNTKLSFSQCNLCRKIAIWVDKKMVYPRVSLLPEPNEDMNDEIKVVIMLCTQDRLILKKIHNKLKIYFMRLTILHNK